MTIYLLNLFSIILYQFLLNTSTVIPTQKRSEVLCWVVGVQLLLTAVLRNDSVGGDLIVYLEVFNTIKNLQWNEVISSTRFEYGYLLLNKISSLISEDGRVLIVITSLCVVIGYIYYIYKNSRIKWLSLFLFIALGHYLTSLSMLRQSIAIVILLNSLQFVEKRQFVRFLLCIISASCFHVTAIVFIVLYPLAKFKISIGYFLIIFFLSFALSKLFGNIFLFTAIEQYFTNYDGKIIAGEGYNMLFLLFLITFLGIVFYKFPDRHGKKINIPYQMMILACSFQLFSLQFSLFSRIVLYFSTAMIVFVPNVLSLISDKKIRLMAQIIVCILATLYLIIIVLARNTSNIYPYTFMWD